MLLVKEIGRRRYDMWCSYMPFLCLSFQQVECCIALSRIYIQIALAFKTGFGFEILRTSSAFGCILGTLAPKIHPYVICKSASEYRQQTTKSGNSFL